MKIAVVFLLALLCCTYALAHDDFYADIIMDVDATGVLTITGTTNHPELSEGIHHEYVTKAKGYWLINISTQRHLGNYIYKLMLPEGAQINYLKSDGRPRIAQEGNRLSIIETGEDKDIDILVQYSIPDENNTAGMGSYIAMGIALIAIGAFLFALRFFKRDSIPHDLDIDAFTDRQGEIIKTLKAHKGQLTQKQLEKTLGLPKSSISRNINALIQKGAVEKIGKGKTNIIRIKSRRSKQ